MLGGIERSWTSARRGARARVRDIPDGIYEAESFMDDDGVDDRRAHSDPRAGRDRRGDRMNIDLTDVVAEVAGFYNSGETAGRSCCQVAFKCLTSPLDLPINDGQFRALEIVLPPGRVVSAVKPGADALVDDLSDDDHRHDLQGAGAGDPRRASSPAITPISSSRRINGRRPRTTASTSISAG